MGVIMDTVQNYITGLKKAYADSGAGEKWAHFERIAHGADRADIEKLRTAYPETPDCLIELLNYVDGTYHREYAGERTALYFLGSDVEGYPYYLLSAEQMTEKEDMEWLFDFVNRKFGDAVSIDERITDNARGLCWLHFSDCMNNGGSSQLFIDFSPSSKGKKGQIVRYLHDPDELWVIADSFEEYLQKLMRWGYDFLSEVSL